MFRNYKLNSNIIINGYGDIDDKKIIREAFEPYELIRGYWENNKKINGLSIRKPR